MSKIDDMIKKLCPNGVEYKKLGEFAKRVKGTPITAAQMKQIASENGEIRIFAGGKTVVNAKEKDIPNANITRVPAVLVQSRGMIDFVYYDKPFTFKNEMWAYTFDNKVSTKFFYYVLKNNVNHFRSLTESMGAFPQIALPDTEKFSVPVPPLEIQEEIVRILDNFTDLTADLTAELTARRKQYEYYRDALLSFGKVPLTFGLNNEEVRWMTLGEIATDIFRGAGITRDQITQSGIPCVRYGEIYTTYGVHFDKCVSHTKLENIPSPKFFEHGDILFAITGESIEDIAKSTAYMGKEKCLAGGDIVVLKHKQNPKYLAYALSTTDAQKQKGAGKVKSKVVHSSVPAISELKIPVPSLALQEKIANVLDNFDAVCNDLNIGLPAEISLRKKQYEYYRDRILSFDTNVNNSIHGGGSLHDEIKLLQYVFGYAMVRLGDIATQFRGEYITQKNSKKGKIPVILGGLEPAYYIDKPNHYGEIIVVSRSGASAGFVSQWNEPIFITDGFGFEAKRDVVTHKFLYYSLKNKEIILNDMKRGAGVPHVSGEKLISVTFPIPSLSEQERIVAILDKFDALVNDLSQGIPAEIEARKKQYEYYRDKLLNFKSKVA